MTENIVSFPNNFTDNFPSTVEESLSHITAVRQEYCDEVTADVLEAVVGVLASYNIHINSNEEHIKDIVFAEETIKALIYRYKNLPHSFHSIIESVITLTDEAKQDLEDKKKALENS